VLKSKYNERVYCSRSCINKGRELGAYDLSFLNKDAPFRSWFLGWIMADGHVSKRNSVALGITDKEIIDIMKEKTKYKNKISVTQSGPMKNTKYIAKAAYHIQFRQDAVNRLVKLGFSPGKKSGKEFIPSCVSNKTFSHFLRGVVEGDGCISRSEKDGYLTLSIASASKKFLNNVLKELQRCNLAYGGCISTTSSIYQLGFGHGDALRICNYIYKDSTGMRLTRKYDKYMSAKGKELKCHIQPSHCTIPGCEHKCLAKNLCTMHYRAQRYTNLKHAIKEV